MARKISIPLDQNQTFAALLGRLVGHWAFLESELQAHFSEVIGMGFGRGRIVWNSFISIPPKLDLMERLCHQSKVQSDYQKQLLVLLPDVRRCNGQRTKFVHALYAAGETADGVHIIPNTLERDTKKTHRKSESIAAKQLEAIIDEIAELSHKFHDLRIYHLRA